MFKITHTSILYVVIICLVSILYIQRDNKTQTYIPVVIPEKKGEFTDYKPAEIECDEDFKLQLKDSIIHIIKEEVDKKKKEFEQLPSKKKDSVYSEAVKPRVYRNTFKDDNVEITYTATTLGTLENLDLDYLIKPIDTLIPITVNKPRTHILFGGSMRVNTYLDKPVYSVSAGLLTKKKNLIQVSYDTDKSIQVGYMIKIL